MPLAKYRKTVDTFAPSVGKLYRVLRDQRLRRESFRTKHGFTLAGSPLMGRDDYEVDEVNAFLALLDEHEAVVDIGANVGFYSCLAASRGKRVIAFEPSGRNLGFLYRNLWENQLSGVEVFPVGLAERAGIERMYGFGGIASFVPGWGQARAKESALVPVNTLDSILAARLRGRRLLIKMDVEGFELAVLKGAEETLALHPHPTWLMEILLSDDVIPGKVNSRFAEVFDVFWKREYKCERLTPVRGPVSPGDVARWTANNSVDSGTTNFLFTAL
jgi:FkbM family methyltransferase